VDDLPPGRVVLVLDTNVYINDAGGNLPAAVETLLDRALLFHCSVCLAELAVGVANGDPRHKGWAATRDHYGGLIASVPSTRLLVPDAATWAEAGLMAGTLARTQGLQRHQRKECLNDALILLTAARAGLAVLTANRDEFDLLQQLAPEGRFVHY
jgi:predicted nucleic acid-binding protein